LRTFKKFVHKKYGTLQITSYGFLSEMVDETMDSLDVDNDGYVDYPEFKIGYMRSSPPTQEEL
jgi:hypothetical protein